MRYWLVSFLAIGLLTGCSSYAVSRYGVSVTNVTALRQMGGRPSASATSRRRARARKRSRAEPWGRSRRPTSARSKSMSAG